MHCSSTLLSCDHHCLLHPPGKPSDKEQSPNYVFVQCSQLLPVAVGCLMVSNAVQCCEHYVTMATNLFAYDSSIACLV